MKNTILIIAALFICPGAKAQLTLEHTFSPVSIYASGQVILFSSNGEKILMCDTGTNQVKLYNTDYSLWKTINLSHYAGYRFDNVSAISDNLFNSDNLVELVAVYYNPSAGSYPTYFKSEVINENSVVVQDLGNAISAQVHVINGNYKLFTETYYAQASAGKYDIYTLPGSLPCGQCGSLGTQRSGEENREALSPPAPNPNSGGAVINYQLPVGVEQGTITIYNANGQSVKTYQVGNNFQSIDVSSANLPSGVYYYNLTGAGITPMGNKMVVIH